MIEARQDTGGRSNARHTVRRMTRYRAFASIQAGTLPQTGPSAAPALDLIQLNYVRILNVTGQNRRGLSGRDPENGKRVVYFKPRTTA